MVTTGKNVSTVKTMANILDPFVMTKEYKTYKSHIAFICISLTYYNLNWIVNFCHKKSQNSNYNLTDLVAIIMIKFKIIWWIWIFVVITIFETARLILLHFLFESLLQSVVQILFSSFTNISLQTVKRTHHCQRHIRFLKREQCHLHTSLTLSLILFDFVDRKVWDNLTNQMARILQFIRGEFPIRSNMMVHVQ